MKTDETYARVRDCMAVVGLCLIVAVTVQHTGWCSGDDRSRRGEAQIGARAKSAGASTRPRLGLPAAESAATAAVAGVCQMDEFPWAAGPAEFAQFVRKVSPKTDKVTLHQYEKMYHQYASQIVRGKCDSGDAPVLNILEIGLGCGMQHGPGGGVDLWHKVYSPPLQLNMHVFEYAETCGREWEARNPGKAKVYYGDQGNAENLADAISFYDVPGGFDIIMDDASHLSTHMFESIKNLIAHLKPGGVYIVEDIHSSCKQWRVKVYKRDGNDVRVGGTKDCMKQKDGTPTFLAHVFEWMKVLAAGDHLLPGLPDVHDIHVFRQAVVFQKSGDEYGHRDTAKVGAAWARGKQ